MQDVKIIKKLMIGKRIFQIGDKVRIQTGNEQIGFGGYIGTIKDIGANHITLEIPHFYDRILSLTEIRKIRMATKEDSFNIEPYFDEEEKLFWETHWYSHGQIVEKTPEDITWLKEFAKQVG